jgi:hypothetical protein
VEAQTNRGVLPANTVPQMPTGRFPMRRLPDPERPGRRGGYHITGCKFSREHILLFLALVEVQNTGRVWCRQKNVW